jgi:hypothetical protein
MGIIGMVGDPTSLPADRANTLVGVINSAITRYYVHAPGNRKSSPVTQYLQAPISVSVTLTQGSTAISGFSTTDRIGDTLLIGDRKCVLGIGNSLREPWPLTSGTYGATLYDDAVPIYTPLRTIQGSVIYNEDTRLRFLGESPIRSDNLYLPRRTGHPEFYSVESLGDAVGSGLRAFLRIFPAPAEASTIRFLATLEPQVLTISSLQVPVSMYLPDSDIEAFVVPFIASELATGVLWPDKIAREPAITKGKETEQLLRLYHEPTGGSVRVITPAGF